MMPLRSFELKLCMLLILVYHDIAFAMRHEVSLEEQYIKMTKVHRTPTLFQENINERNHKFEDENDTVWISRSRGLGVGEKRIMKNSKNDSMERIVKGSMMSRDDDEEGGAVETPKTKIVSKSMLAMKLGSKGDGMGSSKNSINFPTSSPVGTSLSVAPSNAPMTTSNNTPTPAFPPVTNSTTDHIVRLENYFMSFVAIDAIRSPTTDEYAEMLQRITTYFEEFLKEYYSTSEMYQNISLVSIETSNDFNLFNTSTAAVPEERFNIYMNFKYSDFIYVNHEASTSNSTLPDPVETFEILLLSITPDLILDVVRTYVMTPFETTNEVYCGRSNYTDGQPQV